ncbi:sex-determining region Y protein-like isoform X2 [Dunckerocampus dactyliophorus]|uniref:sex-determining region Y protein-like isoform X2 n=1 Tax=Dunckerocampus dactyliophorus TaxID=161453 RepID=UPI002405EA89|nr:sex-determining region Y protein-like isoform X2 [Dunckerocampus dactyliophorus]
MKPIPSEAAEEEWYDLLMPLLEPMEGIYVDLDYQQCHSEPPPPVDPEDVPLFTFLTENDIGYLGNHLTYSPPPTSIHSDDLPLSNPSTGSQHSDSSDCSNLGDTVDQYCCMVYSAPVYSNNMQPALWHIWPLDAGNKQCLEEHPKMLLDCTTLTHTEMPASTNVSTSKKRKRDVQENGDKAYIKKPPNAFMLFRKEQRLKVMAQFNIRDSAEANKALGHMWKSLSEQEQEKYYRLADAEKGIHSQLYPDWSYTDNYGKKRGKQKAETSTKKVHQCKCDCHCEAVE